MAGRGAFLPLQLPAQPQTARQRTLTLATLPAGPRPRLVRVPPRSENTFDTPMSTSSKQRGAAQQRCEGGWQNPRAITTTRSSAGQPEQATQLGSASNSGAPITSSAAGMQRDRSPVDKSGTRAGFESMRWIVRGASAWRVAHARGRTAGAAGCSSVAEGTGAWSRGRQRRTERVRMLLSSTGCAGAIKLPRWGSHRMIEPGEPTTWGGKQPQSGAAELPQVGAAGATIEMELHGRTAVELRTPRSPSDSNRTRTTLQLTLDERFNELNATAQ